MQWLELSFQDRSPAWIARLEALWTATVQADHSALPRHTVQDLAAGVVQVLRTVAHLTVALDDTGAPVGVLGVSGHSLELFFLPPDQQGTGLGSRLFQHAMAKHYLAQITVWEANTRALGFFLRRSYRIHHRTPADPQGYPFPTLYLTLFLLLRNPAACVLYNTGCRAIFSPAPGVHLHIQYSSVLDCVLPQDPLQLESRFLQHPAGGVVLCEGFRKDSQQVCPGKDPLEPPPGTAQVPIP